MENFDEEGTSRSSDRPIRFGYTKDGRYVAVVFEWIDDVTIFPVTAYEIGGQTMSKQRTGRRVVREPSADEKARYRRALAEEQAGVEANKAVGREALRNRRELSDTVSELKSIREASGISLTELAVRTGMTVSNLSRLENMAGPNPTIETLRRYAQAIGYRIAIEVVADT